MKQFSTIFNFELKYYLKNKVFAGVTIFLMLLIAFVMFFPRISEAIKQEETNKPSTSQSADSDDAATADSDDAESNIILVKTADKQSAQPLEATFTEAFPDNKIQMFDGTVDEIKDKITSEEVECAFVITSPTEYTYYVNNLSMYDMNTTIVDEILKQSYTANALIQNGVSIDKATEIISTTITSKTESLGVDMMQNYWYTYIMIFALYMVILLYGQMVATNVATEKSSRAMEVLITSAKPTSMMFGKVIASCLAGLIQLVAVFGSAILFYSINKSYWADNMIINSIFDMPLSLLGFMLIFFVLGFFIYAFLYGAVGSTASKLEDINTSVMPITMLFIVAFMVVMFSFASGSVDTTLMKVFSFIPFSSPMAMFTRIAMSTVPWYEIVISIAILIGSVIGVGILAAKIYRVGVLLYGTTPKLSSILKTVWKA